MPPLYKKENTPLLILIFTIGIILRLWIINQSFWWDEIWSTLPYAKAERFWTTISTLGYYFNNHIFYSILCRITIKLFGESEWSVRLPSLLFGISTFWVIYYAGAKLFSHRVGLVAAFLLAISPIHIDHSAEARGYSLLAFFSLVSTLCFFFALQSGKRSLWVLFCLSAFFGFYSHTFMLIPALVQFLTFVILFLVKPLCSRCTLSRENIRPYFIALCITTVAVVIFYLPIFPSFISNIKKVQHVDSYPFPFLYDLACSIFPGFSNFPGIIFYTALLVGSWASLYRKNMLFFLYTLLLLLLPPLLYVSAKPGFLFERYFISLLPFAVLLISHGIDCLCRFVFPGNRFFQMTIVIACLSFITANSLPSLEHVITLPRQNYKEAIKYAEREIKKHGGKGSIIAIGYAGSHFKYYATLPLHIPNNIEDLQNIIAQTPSTWCLITAWLPDIRRSYENPNMFLEDPEQTKIHDYVVRNFKLIKTFPARIPTYLYRFPNA